MKRQILFLLLLSLLLIACGEPVEEEPLPSPTAAATSTAAAPASAVPTKTTLPEPTASATPFPTIQATATPTTEPEVMVEPLTRARQLIEQVEPAAPEGWQVTPCEGAAPILCVGDGQQHVGYAELIILPLTSYPDDHPVRQAAAAMPDDPAAYAAEQETAVQQALTTLADEHLEVIADDRAITYPDDTFTRLPAAPAQMGRLPALSFGFVHTNPAGDVVERYLNVAAFDQDFIYWFGTNYDPANVTTSVSDTAVTQFTPFFVETAANFAIP